MPNIDRVANIKKYKEQQNRKEIEKEKISASNIKKYAKQIRALKPRIDEIIAVGNACKENDIPLSGSGRGGYEGYDTHQFISNGWSHVVGFIKDSHIQPFTKVGVVGGGFCDWNLETNGDEIIAEGDVETVLKIFLDGFDTFESEFYKYVDEITKDVDETEHER